MQYEVTGPLKYYFVGILFTVIGLFFALLLPYLLTPKLTPEHQISAGTVIDYQEDEEGTKWAEKYQFTDQAGKIQNGVNFVSSSNPFYQIGDQLEVAYLKSNPTSSFILNDPNLQSMSMVMGILGYFFAILGLLILGLKMINFSSVRIDIIAGTIGALAYAIPATFLIPLMYFAHVYRPNFLFNQEDLLWTQENIILMAIFTSTGLLTLLGLAFMLNHYRKTGSNTWSKSYQSKEY